MQLKTLRVLTAVFLLNRQFRAALDAAPFNYGASGLGCNTCTKSVRASAVTSVWLKCSLWHIRTSVPQTTPISKVYV